MPLSQRWTLTRYLIEERRRFPQASGDLNALILDLSLACKAIARIVSFGELGEALAPTGPVAPAGLEALSRDIFIRMNEWNGHLAGLSALGLDGVRAIGNGHGRGKYLLTVASLEGSGDLDVNVPAGSLFSILRTPQAVIDGEREVSEADFLQPGHTQVAAGYVLYGPATMLVLTVGNGVAGFTLNHNLGEFVLTHPRLQVPADTPEIAVNTGESRAWEPPIKRYVDECLAGRNGPRGKDFKVRGLSSLVAEVHRTLVRGGVFLQPRDPRDGRDTGRTHLLHVAHPIGFVLEQAGGRASTGRQSVLGLQPSALHQRLGLVFGSRHEVERIERYHQESQMRDPVTPLFSERGLFRS